jgi:hypothetical protein
MRTAQKLIAIMGGRKLFPFSDSFAVDGALGPRWTGATWAISGGVAVNTPVDGAAVAVTNGDMEAAGTWADQGTPVSQGQSAEQVHGGAASWKIVADAITEGITQTVGGHSLNTWYHTRGYFYVSSNSAKITMVGVVGGNATGSSSAAAWAAADHVGPANNANKILFITTNGAGTFYVDDVTINALAASELIASVDTKQSSITVSAAMTIANMGSCTGVVLCLDNPANPQNFLYGIVQQNASTPRCFLIKCLGGTYSQLIGADVTYGAGKVIKLVKSGLSVALYYGVAGSEAQVGATQTLNAVTDANIVSNTRHGMISTNPANSLDNFSIA